MPRPPIRSLAQASDVTADITVRLAAFKGMWEVYYNDLTWIEKSMEASIINARGGLEIENADDLVPKVIERLKIRTRMSENLLAQCSAELTSLLKRQPPGRRVPLSSATRAAAGVGAVYGQVDTLLLLSVGNAQRGADGANIDKARATKQLDKIYKPLIGASTVVATTIALMDDTIEHTQHLISTMVDLLVYVTSISFVQQILINPPSLRGPSL